MGEVSNLGSSALDTKRGIGPSLKYGELILALDDGILYSHAKIASLAVNRDQNLEEYDRIRHAMSDYKKRNYFPEGGDGTIMWEGRPVPAWYGKTWKAALDHLKIKPSGERPSPAVKRLDRRGVRRPGKTGRKLACGKYILPLEPLELYAPETVVERAIQTGAFQAEAIDQRQFNKQAIKNIRIALYKYAKRRLPEQEDGLVKTETGRPVGAWYGYRWLLALPHYLYSQEHKEQLRKDVAASKRSHRAPKPSSDAPVLVPEVTVRTSGSAGNHRQSKARGLGLPLFPIKWFAYGGWLFALLAIILGITWHQFRTEEILVTERKNLFLKWHPELYIHPGFKGDLEDFAETVELFYDIPVFVEPEIKTIEINVESEKIWYKVLEEIGLGWGIENNEKIQIFD